MGGKMVRASPRKVSEWDLPFRPLLVGIVATANPASSEASHTAAARFRLFAAKPSPAAEAAEAKNKRTLKGIDIVISPVFPGGTPYLSPAIHNSRFLADILSA